MCLPRALRTLLQASCNKRWLVSVAALRSVVVSPAFCKVKKRSKCGVLGGCTLALKGDPSP